MHLAALVVAGQGALGHGLHRGIRNFDDALFIGWRALHHDFEQIEQLAGVAPRKGQQGMVLFQYHFFLLQGRVFGQGFLHEAAEGVRAQRLQYIHLAARKQGRDDFKGWILGGRANQRDGAVLYRAQQRILLRLAEPVNFINEQHRTALALGFLNYVAHVFHAGIDGAQGRERMLQLRGQQVGQGGFAYAGRPPQNEAGQPAGVEVAAQYAGFAHQVLLAGIIGQAAGALALGQGGIRPGAGQRGEGDGFVVRK